MIVGWERLSANGIDRLNSAKGKGLGVPAHEDWY
jgi:hypothetical protein